MILRNICQIIVNAGNSVIDAPILQIYVSIDFVGHRKGKCAKQIILSFVADTVIPMRIDCRMVGILHPNNGTVMFSVVAIGGTAHVPSYFIFRMMEEEGV